MSGLTFGFVESEEGEWNCEKVALVGSAQETRDYLVCAPTPPGVRYSACVQADFELGKHTGIPACAMHVCSIAGRLCDTLH